MDKDISLSPKAPKKVKPVGADGHRRRMFDKLVSTDGNALTPRDMLEMLLYFPIRVRDTRDIAVELMEHFDDNIENILTASPEELCKIGGVGPSVASFLNLAGTIHTRLKTAEPPPSTGIPTEQRILEIFADMRSSLSGDELWAILINSSSSVADIVRVMGEFDYPSEAEMYSFMQTALRYHSVGVILIHVTGDMEVYPTTKDIKFLRLMENMLSVTNLMLFDYYVLGSDEILKVSSLNNPYTQS